MYLKWIACFLSEVQSRIATTLVRSLSVLLNLETFLTSANVILMLVGSDALAEPMQSGHKLVQTLPICTMVPLRFDSEAGENQTRVR